MIWFLLSILIRTQKMWSWLGTRELFGIGKEQLFAVDAVRVYPLLPFFTNQPVDQSLPFHRVDVRMDFWIDENQPVGIKQFFAALE